MTISTDRRVDLYLRRGWCPVPWAHHPEPIKRALRALRWRPRMKSCWHNAQRFACEAVRAGVAVEYREGWCEGLIPFTHAWLVYDGAVLDLTLDSTAHTYLDSYHVSRDDLLVAAVLRGCWSPYSPEQLSKLSPYGGGAAWEQIAERVTEQVVSEASP